MSAPAATQVRSFQLDAPVSRVLPLFTAAGERRWVPGWEPLIVSGTEERGSVFITRTQEGRQVTWIVVDYRPDEGRVSYARWVEGSNVGLVDVSCQPDPAGGTEVSVRYTLTGLSRDGSALVRDFLADERYAAMIEEWRAATSTALAAGV
jgi:hypothetical protein